MTDTETRLRDFLQSQADTIPETAQGPGLEEPVRRRHWPVLAAAAAIAVVLAVSATYLARFSGDDVPEPAAPVSTAAPKVPYTVGTTLHDGDQQVRIPKGVDGFFFGRIDGGWLGMSVPNPGHFQAGVLGENGKFRPIGPDRSDGTTLSPDRKQVAVVHYRSTTLADLVIVDIKSGKAVSTTPLTYQPTLRGWNQTGLWMSNETATTSTLMVWQQPGSGQPQTVDLPDFEGGLSAPADTDTITVSTRHGDDRCLKAGVLSNGAFKILRQYCDTGPASYYPLTAPDGRRMVNSDANLVMDLRTGKIIKLQLPAGQQMNDFPPAQFEDANQLILITRPPEPGDPGKKQSLYRCDVRSGECAVLQKNASKITLQEP
jgi:hypothetical protein